MTATEIFNAAIDEYAPRAVFLLTSGGNDSIVPLHMFKDHPSVTAAVHIDTGIKIPDVEQHVLKTTSDLGLPLLVYRATENTKADGTPDPMIYEDIVRTHGFPGPAQHRIMYSKLKERQVRRLVRDHKVDHSDRIMLVTGVRKHESRRRMGTAKDVQRDGAQVWVAPIVNWRDEDMAAYRIANDLPTNPVAENLGMSGECLCGAYAKPGELDRIEKHYPETAKHIRELEGVTPCPWGWEGQPDRKWAELQHGQEALGITPLCTSCVARGRT